MHYVHAKAVPVQIFVCFLGEGDCFADGSLHQSVR